jgi:DNA-binding NarL/FixJ family response regulator
MRRRNAPRKRISILIADQEGVFRLGMKKLFSVEDDLRVVAQAETAGQSAAMVKSFRPDVAFIQAELASSDLLRQARQDSPGSRIVVMTSALSDGGGPEHVRNGACGFISKSVNPEAFVKCVRKVAHGEFWIPKADALQMAGVGGKTAPRPLRPADTLTGREKTIISYLTHGWRNREIAKALTITEQTVKNHLRSIYDKVGVSDRLELVLYAIHQRLELPQVLRSEGPF